MENPWVSWYPGDYINKTRSLTMAQHGAYCLLLWEYYVNGPFLAKATPLLNVCQSRTEADASDVQLVLDKFFVEKDGYYRHERADEEIAKRLKIREQRKLFGKKGGLAKATHLLEQKLKQNPTQSQSHIKPITPLTPLSGGNGAKPLSTRERAKIEKELQRIAVAMQGADYDPADALHRACDRLGIDFHRAEGLLP